MSYLKYFVLRYILTPVVVAFTDHVTDSISVTSHYYITTLRLTSRGLKFLESPFDVSLRYFTFFGQTKISSSLF